MQLHYYPGNASMTPHIVLEELGIPFELVYVDRNVGAHKTPEYLKLNPNGLIPVLVDGDTVLYETPAVCLYLADKHPAAGLAPKVGTAERAQLYKWLAWLNNTMQPALILFYYPERWMDDGDAAGAAKLKAQAERKIGAMLDQLEAQLVHGKHWLLGEGYSLLDPYAMMLCRWTRSFKRPARSLTRLGPYLNRVLARPAVKRALATEKLPAPYV
jgi:glutathione S-transferase